MITVHRKSAVSGISHTMELDISTEQIAAYEAGGLIHKVFNNLTAEQREFILTGITPEEWREYIASNEGEEEENT